MLSLLLMIGLLQSDSCTVRILSRNSQDWKPDSISMFKDPFRNMLVKKSVEATNWIYNEFSKKYYQFLEKNYFSDSCLIIHQYGRGYEIKGSLIIDLTKWEANVLTYRMDSARICKLDYLFKNQKERENILKIGSMKGNVPYPNDWVFHDRSPETYAVEIREKSGKRLYYACIEGLPKNHFANYELSEDSEWYILRSIFEKN